MKVKTEFSLTEYCSLVLNIELNPVNLWVYVYVKQILIDCKNNLTILHYWHAQKGFNG